MKLTIYPDKNTGTKWTATEYHGNGDPFFGGHGDDRPLGNECKFLAGDYNLSDIAEFNTANEAEKAARSATNSRAGGSVAVSNSY